MKSEDNTKSNDNYMQEVHSWLDSGLYQLTKKGEYKITRTGKSFLKENPEFDGLADYLFSQTTKRRGRLLTSPLAQRLFGTSLAVGAFASYYSLASAMGELAPLVYIPAFLGGVLMEYFGRGRRNAELLDIA